MVKNSTDKFLKKKMNDVLSTRIGNCYSQHISIGNNTNIKISRIEKVNIIMKNIKEILVELKLIQKF